MDGTISAFIKEFGKDRLLLFGSPLTIAIIAYFGLPEYRKIITPVIAGLIFALFARSIKKLGNYLSEYINEKNCKKINTKRARQVLSLLRPETQELMREIAKQKPNTIKEQEYGVWYKIADYDCIEENYWEIRSIVDQDYRIDLFINPPSSQLILEQRYPKMPIALRFEVIYQQKCLVFSEFFWRAIRKAK